MVKNNDLDENLQVPERYGLDEGFLCSRLGQFFGRETEKNGSTAMCVWYDHKNPLHSKINQMMTDPLLGLNTSKLRSPKQALHETRVIKSQAEISLMRETCRIACESITETIRRSGKEMSSEAEVFATVDYQVGPLTQFFSVSFLYKIIDLPGGQINDPSSGKHYSL